MPGDERSPACTTHFQACQKAHLAVAVEEAGKVFHGLHLGAGPQGGPAGAGGRERGEGADVGGRERGGGADVEGEG